MHIIYPKKKQHHPETHLILLVKNTINSSKYHLLVHEYLWLLNQQNKKFKIKQSNAGNLYKIFFFC